MLPILILLLQFLPLPPPETDTEPEARAVITGYVLDAETHDPLPGAAVRLREVERAMITNERGAFRFEDVPVRRHTVSVQFLGYQPEERRVVPTGDDTYELTIYLTPSVLELPDVVVTGTGRERGARDTYQPTAVLSGRELERQMGPSLAESIEHLPGVSQQYNGPAASQPVIRGLSGDRVLILEDGGRTGDLSTTAADHAVSLDPVGAERIEVVRGPAGLLYGPNALGGVINVVRGDIPTDMPAGVSGTATGIAESVNDGLTGGIEVRAPVGTFAVRAEVSGRTAGDTRTPLGRLESTGVDANTIGAGISLIRRWGHVGISARQQDMTYGLPGEFQGELIPGAHPGGVTADTRRRNARLRALHTDLPGFFDTAEFEAHVNHYLHDEIEAYTDDGSPIVGAHFDVVSGGGSVALRHEHDLHGHGERFIRAEGALGASMFTRDLLTRGSHVGSRPARELSFAGYLFEEFSTGPVRFQLGARFDWQRTSPKRLDPIRTGGESVPVRERDFRSISGSAALLYNTSPNWTVGLNLARAFRAPAIEELYSDGPHLADYSFDIGNPNLPTEVGHGADLFARGNYRRLNVEVAAFANRISNYIYHRPTGSLDPRFNRYPVYQATADDAFFLGADGRVQWEFSRGFVADATASYVRAHRISDDDPLPFIPPLNTRLNVRYTQGGFTAAAGLTAAARQNRVPRSEATAIGTAISQHPTEGHGLLHADVGYRFDYGGALHSISLHGDNLTGEVWHDHLSRIKDVAPQPGRNVRLTYRVQF